MRNYNGIMSNHTCFITRHLALYVLIKCLPIDLWHNRESIVPLGVNKIKNVNMTWSWHSMDTVIFLIYCVLYVRILTLSACLLFAIISFSVRVFPFIKVFSRIIKHFSWTPQLVVTFQIYLKMIIMTYLMENASWPIWPM